MSKVKVDDILPDFKVTTNIHDDVQLSSLINQKTVFWIIRYIGCTVCRYDVHLLSVNYNRIKDKGIIQSMSRKGNCLDNSPMENFFGKMKNEMFYGYEYTFNTLEELQKEMEDYIYYYNNQRITTKLKGLTPVEYRNQSLITI